MSGDDEDRPKRVVVIHRDPMWRLALDRLVFTSVFPVLTEKYPCLSACDDALGALPAEEYPGLVITGLIFEKGDACDWLSLHLIARPAVTLIVCTACREPWLLQKAWATGVSAVIDGHNAIMDLPWAIHRAEAGRRYVSASLAAATEGCCDLSQQLRALTEKKREVLSALGDGSDDIEAAAALGMKPDTVSKHRRSLERHFGVGTPRALAEVARKLGLVRIEPGMVHRPGLPRREG